MNVSDESANYQSHSQRGTVKVASATSKLATGRRRFPPRSPRHAREPCVRDSCWPAPLPVSRRAPRLRRRTIDGSP